MLLSCSMSVCEKGAAQYGPAKSGSSWNNLAEILPLRPVSQDK